MQGFKTTLSCNSCELLATLMHGVSHIQADVFKTPKGKTKSATKA